jgi:hypothetical protein
MEGHVITIVVLSWALIVSIVVCLFVNRNCNKVHQQLERSKRLYSITCDKNRKLEQESEEVKSDLEALKSINRALLR